MSEKRQQLMETAYRLFNRHGFHATGIDRIWAEAGSTKRTLYRHFPTKDALIEAVLLSREQEFFALLEAKQYNYRFYYEWYNARGERCRSLPTGGAGVRLGPGGIVQPRRATGSMVATVWRPPA